MSEFIFKLGGEKAFLSSPDNPETVKRKDRYLRLNKNYEFTVGPEELKHREETSLENISLTHMTNERLISLVFKEVL